MEDDQIIETRIREIIGPAWIAPQNEGLRAEFIDARESDPCLPYIRKQGPYWLFVGSLGESDPGTATADADPMALAARLRVIADAKAAADLAQAALDTGVDVRYEAEEDEGDELAEANCGLGSGGAEPLTDDDARDGGEIPGATSYSAERDDASVVGTRDAADHSEGSSQLAYPGIMSVKTIDERRSYLSKQIDEIANIRAEANRDVMRNTDIVSLTHLIMANAASPEQRAQEAAYYRAKTMVERTLDFADVMKRSLRDKDGDELDVFEPLAVEWPADG